MSVQILRVERLDTPLGELLVVTDDRGALRAVDWRDYKDRMRALLRRHLCKNPIFQEDDAGRTDATYAISAYFDGDVDAIGSLAVSMGGTEFQNAVWNGLREIPPGEIISYGVLAERIGRPTAVRAVGLANGANPVGVVVPCHRVIGADGSLTGYGGGLERKRWLLEHERVWKVCRTAVH